MAPKRSGTHEAARRPDLNYRGKKLQKNSESMPNQRVQYSLPIVFCTKPKKFQKIAVWAGGRCHPDPPVFGWGGKDHPPKRSFVTFDRGGQTRPPRSNAFFFGAADDTGAVDDRPTGRPPSRPAGRPPNPNQKPVSQTLILGGTIRSGQISKSA